MPEILKRTVSSNIRRCNDERIKLWDTSLQIIYSSSGGQSPVIIMVISYCIWTVLSILLYNTVKMCTFSKLTSFGTSLCEWWPSNDWPTLSTKTRYIRFKIHGYFRSVRSLELSLYIPYCPIACTKKKPFLLSSKGIYSPNRLLELFCEVCFLIYVFWIKSDSTWKSPLKSDECKYVFM